MTSSLRLQMKTFVGVVIVVIMLTFLVYLLVSNGEPSPGATHLWDGSLDRRADASPSQKTLDQTVIMYNRLPKTGSTSFVNLVYSLCVKNRVHVLHLNVTRNSHVMNLANQLRLVLNISDWNAMKPALYHGHLAYLDFARFGSNVRPLYINLLRDPLDRLVSYYYFLRFGDDYRPHLKRRRMKNRRIQMQTFDECVMVMGKDCDPVHLWLQIPFFCGHEEFCWKPGNVAALEQAKRNLVDKYFLVGVTEEMLDFVTVLERVLPRFFSGASQRYRSGKKSHLRKTNNKKSLSSETVSKFQQSPIWKMEQEFYQFAKDNFDNIRDRLFARTEDGDMEWNQQKFHYEKIRPRIEGTEGKHNQKKKKKKMQMSGNDMGVPASNVDTVDKPNDSVVKEGDEQNSPERQMEKRAVVDNSDKNAV